MHSQDDDTSIAPAECVLTLPAEIESLPAFLKLVRQCAEQVALDAPRIAELEVAVEEAVANVCAHGYPQGRGDVAIRCFTEADGTHLCVEIADSGEPFDVSAAAGPDLSGGLHERPVGGLGVHLIRQLADEVRYERSGNRNILRIVIHAGPRDEG